MRQRARASLLARVCACMKRESRLRRRHADQSARARRERGSRVVARTIIADRKSPHANSCRPGHQHVGPAGGARRHHKAAAFARAANAHCIHMHTWTRASAWSMCARVRVRAHAAGRRAAQPTTRRGVRSEALELRPTSASRSTEVDPKKAFHKGLRDRRVELEKRAVFETNSEHNGR